MFDQGPHAVLRRDGVCIVLKTPTDEMPQVEYWGADFGLSPDEAALTQLDAMTLRITPPNEKPDAALRPSLLPQGAEAFAGRPGLEAYRGGRPVFVRWTSVTTFLAAEDRETEATAITVAAEDSVNKVRLNLKLSLKKGGLAMVEQTVSNIDGANGGENSENGPLTVNWLESTMPMPRRADTLTQFTGRWPLEKQPRTAAMPSGSVTRECRHGKTSHESPWMFIASDGEPKWASGEVWACHLAWSGNQTYRIDNLPPHETLIGAGELLGPGEIQLAAGESYEAPQVCFSYSATGLDGMAARFHTWLRSLPKHVSSPRPFTINTWEAVYFNHDEATLIKLADRAANIGVERFVLDDGWFHERRDDTRGLGDWVVDPEVWPNGLDNLAKHVHDLGMQFGLWFEPEMVNLDSDCAREHPDWILAAPEAVPYREDVSYRTQYVLDLANPAAYEHVRGQMAALVEQLGIDYIKWDHNRDVTEPVHNGRYGLHEQTEACYKLFDDLKSQFPKLEIESCSSGGARTDAGILQHADRIWGSDSNDPRDRVDIQRYTELVVPPEMIGAHVGPSPAHSTWRATELSYRAAISLEGCSGFEWNILECSDDEVEQLRAFVSLYKELRGVLHHGTVMHADFKDPALRGRGVVSDDGKRAVWVVATVTNLRDVLTERLRMPGLDPDCMYRVRLRDEVGEVRWGWNTPQWISAAQMDSFKVSGRLLNEIGLPVPPLWPLEAIVLEVEAL